jgi:hypothetical protein
VEPTKQTSSHQASLSQYQSRVLISYHYFRKVDLGTWLAKNFRKPYPAVFADSGAYSAATQGVPIDVSEYSDWLQSNAQHTTVYANLDVIGDASATWRNQKTLERAGLSPLPVYHTGEDWSFLQRYQADYEYIALGGQVGWSAKKLLPWLVRCFKQAKPTTRFHGFGMTTWSVLMALPFYSVDSTSWGAGFLYGRVPLFDSKRQRFDAVQLGNHSDVYRVARLIRSHGHNPIVFADRKQFKVRYAAEVSAIAYMKAEQYLRRRHGPIACSGREDGLCVYLASGNTAALVFAHDALIGATH